MASSVVALVAGLFGLASGHIAVGLVAVILAALAGAAGIAWLAYAHRRAAKERSANDYSDDPCASAER